MPDQLTQMTTPALIFVHVESGTNHQDAFFDVRVFYLNAPSNRSTNAYRRSEQVKKREYGQRVHEVECGVFTPLILSTNGGMGKRSYHILQATCRHDCTKETTFILHGHRIAQVAALIRIHPILHHVHSGKPLITTQTCMYVYMDNITLASQECNIGIAQKCIGIA